MKSRARYRSPRKFCRVCGTAFFRAPAELSKPRSLSEWQRDLRETLDAFFEADEAAQRELNRLRAAIAALGEIGAASQNESAVPLDVATAQLQHSLDESSGRRRLSVGQLSFLRAQTNAQHSIQNYLPPRAERHSLSAT
jgi:hypothetical protein